MRPTEDAAFRLRNGLWVFQTGSNRWLVFWTIQKNRLRELATLFALYVYDDSLKKEPICLLNKIRWFVSDYSELFCVHFAEHCLNYCVPFKGDWKLTLSGKIPFYFEKWYSKHWYRLLTEDYWQKPVFSPCVSMALSAFVRFRLI